MTLIDELRELRGFLDGSGGIDGASYGESHPTKRGNWWWRSYLTRIDQAIRALEAAEANEKDINRLIREFDAELNDGVAAKQALLCDVVAQAGGMLRALKAELATRKDSETEFNRRGNEIDSLLEETAVLEAQRDSLTEQLGLARKDAERYRWLRDASPNSTFNTPTVVDGFRGIDDHCTMLEGVVLDAAIDAALASQAVPR